MQSFVENNSHYCTICNYSEFHNEKENMNKVKQHIYMWKEVCLLSFLSDCFDRSFLLLGRARMLNPSLNEPSVNNIPQLGSRGFVALWNV